MHSKMDGGLENKTNTHPDPETNRSVSCSPFYYYNKIVVDFLVMEPVSSLKRGQS